ncbi:MAG: hypothetical protein KIT09_21555 [Bryobacteraceae bacterium]|nr:hypothetical protein [Bryobacteraceae bacterium]
MRANRFGHLALALFASANAFGQCSMCRTALESNPEFGDAINAGILILLVPAVLLFSGVYAIAFRYHDSAEPDDSE